jgi:hypothetical protein
MGAEGISSAEGAMSKISEKTLRGICLLLLFATAAYSQSGGSFVIKQSVIANGGGASSGGAFGVKSTIGQPLAGTQSLGGNFRILSGSGLPVPRPRRDVRFGISTVTASPTSRSIFRTLPSGGTCVRSTVRTVRSSSVL